MDPDPLLFYLVALLIIISGFFAGAEAALFSLSTAQLQTLITQKKKNALLLQQIKADPQKLVLTILFSRNLVKITAAALLAVMAYTQWGSAGIIVSIVVLLVVVLYIGEILPKSYAQKNATAVALGIAPLMRGLMVIFFPLISIFYYIAVALRKMFGIHESTKEISEDDVRAMVTLGQQGGSVEADEREMIEKVFLLNDITVEDVMTPEEYVIGFDADMEMREAIPIMYQSGHSRFPIYSLTEGDVQGILYLKDVFTLISQEYTKEEKQSVSIQHQLSQHVSKFQKQALFVPETMHVDDLLRDFQKKHMHMAIVVDEHGVVQGLITLEDILEEIVGEIIDETDSDTDMIETIDTSTIIVDPRVTIGRVNTVFDSHLKGSRQKTIGWLVLKHFGRIPTKGDAVTIFDHQFIIEEAEEHRIKRIKIIKTAKAKLK